jgi:anaerobic selenocysteine-containing dehydrogenase
VLNVLSGHLDSPGGAMFAKSAAFASNTTGKPGIGKGVSTGRHFARVSGAPEVFGELPITCIAEEIETAGPQQIRVLFTVATNPVLSSPNGPRLAAALDTLDFMVSMDIYLNETTRHADVILPGLSPLEDFHYDLAFPQLSWRNHARYSPPVLARTDGAPEEWQTLLKLAAIVRVRARRPTPTRWTTPSLPKMPSAWPEPKPLRSSGPPAASKAHSACSRWHCEPAPMATCLA